MIFSFPNFSAKTSIFLFMAKNWFTMNIYHIFLILWYITEHLAWFHNLDTMRHAARSLDVHGFLWYAALTFVKLFAFTVIFACFVSIFFILSSFINPMSHGVLAKFFFLQYVVSSHFGNVLFNVQNNVSYKYFIVNAQLTDP